MRAQQGHSKGTARAQTISNKARKKSSDDQLFDEAWNGYPKRSGGNSRAAALRAWRASIGRGVTPAEMVAGVIRYKAFTRAVGSENTPFVKQASTFFGPDEHWRDDWEIPADAGMAARGLPATLSQVVVND